VSRQARSRSAVELALHAVRRGEVIAVATDTVYGLACDPAAAAAVDRVYAIKRRPGDLELILLAADSGDLEGLVQWNATARALAGAFWPGALSLILPVGERRVAVPRRGTTLSVRVPDHRLLRDLLARTGPLASTSANRHGAPPVTSVAALRREFGTEVGALLTGGRPRGMASTIIDCSGSSPRVVRVGPIDSQRLAEFVQA
jgi:L-threonylcarbamoyladenylate synthase